MIGRLILVVAFIALGVSRGDCVTPGAVDVTFNSGSWIDGAIRSAVVQSDGKIIIGGTFTMVRGAMRGRIARLHPDGTVDTTFNPGTGADYDVLSVVLQPDGKVVIAGYFTQINGVNRNGVARLNADGSLDQTFAPTPGANDIGYSPGVECVAVQSDGKVVIGGWFYIVNGISRPGIARLNANGTLDESFNPAPGVEFDLSSLAVQSDGKVLAGGKMRINYVDQYGIFRVNANGTIDGSFSANSIFSTTPTIRSIRLQTDGKIVVGGTFSTSGGAGVGIVRLNTNGSADPGFNPGTGVSYGSVISVSLHTDGKLIVGGGFPTFNEIERNSIARLNSNGSLDTSFDPGTGPNTTIWSVFAQSNGEVVAAGEFSSFNEVYRSKLARLESNGSLDPELVPGRGISGSVQAVAVQNDGRVLIAGNFAVVNPPSNAVLKVARLNVDGSVDTTFRRRFGVSGDYVSSLALQSDGKVVLGGAFTSIDGTNRNCIARLNTNGTLDVSFNAGTMTAAPSDGRSVECIVVQPDGKMLIGGTFTNLNGTGRNRIARLNSDGTVDATFDPGTGANYTVMEIALQNDGRMIMGGSFTSFNGVVRNRLARLDANGTLDVTFNPNANHIVRSVILQPDGKIIVGGNFTFLNGTDRFRVARLNANGSLDLTFNAGAGLQHTTYSPEANCLALQADGKVLVGGSFNTVNGFRRNRIVRLHSDGGIDLTFSAGRSFAGVNDTIYSLVLQSEGSVLVGGMFYDVGGEARPNIARLAGGNLSLSSLPLGIRRVNNSVVLNWTNEAFSLQKATSLTGNYTDIYGAVSPYTNVISTPPSYFRLRAQ